MTKRSRIARLFTIKTRSEAWLVTYAIAVGAVERGQHYLATYPGAGGWLLALACTGVVFVAGAKLLDAVRLPLPAVAAGPHPVPMRQHAVSRSQPRLRQTRFGSASPISLRTD